MLREKRRARIAFRCHQRLLNQIKQEAAAYNVTMSSLIVRILSEGLLQPCAIDDVRHDQSHEPIDPSLAKILSLLNHIENQGNERGLTE